MSQDLRTQLLQERESVRHISLQKDIELKELQARIEKNVGVLVLISTLKLIPFARHKSSRKREALVEAQTSRKHLEEKVEDLSRQLKGNVEKLAVYERRPSNLSQPADQDISREQQLETEVADLRFASPVFNQHGF